MRLVTILVLVFTFILCSSISATIINVPGDYPDIQSGIDASSNGDTVLVHPGTYYENIMFNGHAIHLASLFLTTGDTTYISQTIIDGGGTFATIVLMGYENPSAITGLTITGGAGYAYGGGIALTTQSWCTIKHNIITGNSSNDQGGGIFMYANYGDVSHNIITNNSANHGGGILTSIYGSGFISDNIVTNNTANSGGGMYFHNSLYTVENNYIANNTANGNGGGVTVNFKASPTFLNNTITNNTATTSGGGMYLNGNDSAKVYHNLIYNNNGAYYGGGIYIVDSKTDIQNCTIADNTAGDGGGMLINNFSDVTILNTIMWGSAATPGSGDEINIDASSTLTVNYSDIAGGWAGTGNIDSDPMFIYPDTGNFYLNMGSPCIDAGDPSSPFDPDNTIADMGCFYYDQMVGIEEDDRFLIPDFALLQNYPNPFNTTTIIEYTLRKAGYVELSIYNILGEKISTLFSEKQQIGNYKMKWDASKFTSGLYFYRLKTDKGYAQSRKLILLK